MMLCLHPTHPPVQPAALVVDAGLEVGLLPYPPPRLLHRLHVLVVVGGRSGPLLPSQTVRPLYR